ncbi:LuxR C-terminal-related transcriptional regulator [Haliangium sp.]|uniref:helix-turn-helix transcriptional regulator n=1 Tax=Haliangium sp. TaxID=2663208 RepID=UPI003D0CAF34
MWNAVAEYLIERFEEPIVVFDRNGVVLSMNSALERLLGWPRSDVLRRSWAEICPPGEDGRQAMARIVGGIDGISRRLELPARKADGDILTLVVNITHLEAGNERATMASVIAARPRAAVTQPGVECSQYYEISGTPGKRGTLSFVWEAGETEASQVGKLCYQAFYGRNEPCVQCPAFEEGKVGDVRHGVVRFGDEGDRFGMVRAEFAEHSVRVNLRRISRDEVSSLVRARVDLLAKEGGLSSREHSVLELLIAGKSADDIGAALGISPRTAKFHQTNILQKLGVDSRLELFRLVVE